jgi:hypothetical protein
MKKLLCLVFLSTFVLSCQKNKEGSEESKISTSFEAERDAFFSNLASPGDAAAGLQATAAEFNPNLMNDPKLSAGYATSDAKAAANLGVYLSDLNYSIAYGQSANTKELFTAAHELGKYIGLEQTLLEFLMKRQQKLLLMNCLKNLQQDLKEPSVKNWLVLLLQHTKLKIFTLLLVL